MVTTFCEYIRELPRRNRRGLGKGGGMMLTAWIAMLPTGESRRRRNADVALAMRELHNAKEGKQRKGLVVI